MVKTVDSLEFLLSSLAVAFLIIIIGFLSVAFLALLVLVQTVISLLILVISPVFAIVYFAKAIYNLIRGNYEI